MSTQQKPHVLEMPKPKAHCITQTKLQELKVLIEQWESEGRRVAEDCAKIIADLANGAEIEPGRLTPRVLLSGTGPEEILRLSIE
jgi:hypothetical protein